MFDPDSFKDPKLPAGLEVVNVPLGEFRRRWVKFLVYVPHDATKQARA